MNILAAKKKNKQEKIHFQYKCLHANLKSKFIQQFCTKKHQKDEKLHKKQAKKSKEPASKKPKLYVIYFDGDIKASCVDFLREEITAVLSVATKEDEVLVDKDEPSSGEKS